MSNNGQDSKKDATDFSALPALHNKHVRKAIIYGAPDPNEPEAAAPASTLAPAAQNAAAPAQNAVTPAPLPVNANTPAAAPNTSGAGPSGRARARRNSNEMLKCRKCHGRYKAYSSGSDDYCGCREVNLRGGGDGSWWERWFCF